jgi:hypothetical protein
MTKRDWYGLVVAVAFILLGCLAAVAVVLVLGENPVGFIAAWIVGLAIWGLETRSNAI